MTTHTLPLTSSPKIRRVARTFALFVKVRGSNAFAQRITIGAYRLDTMRRLYQDAMLFCAFNGIPFKLRPVDKVVDWDAPGVLHLRCIAESDASCTHNHVGAEVSL